MPIDRLVSEVDGLSKRDRFAKAALIGLLAGANGVWVPSTMAESAYAIADAMLVERRTDRSKGR